MASIRWRNAVSSAFQPKYAQKRQRRSPERVDDTSPDYGRRRDADHQQAALPQQLSPGARRRPVSNPQESPNLKIRPPKNDGQIQVNQGLLKQSYSAYRDN